jgi:hypothetical protein
MPHVFRSALLLPLVLLLLALNLSLPDSARAEEELTARDIMQRVIDRDTGNKSIMDMEMQLIDKNNKVRTREIRSFGLDQGEDDWGVMFFLSPADTKNTGFLTYDYYDDTKDDDQWLYLPALGKEKRIASNDKSSSFMGSDLTNADFIKRKTKNYDYELLGEEEVAGQPVWKIKSTPRTEEEIKETGVLESISWIRKDNYMSIQSVQRLKKKGRTKYFKAMKIEQIDGIWVARELRVFTKKGNVKSHSTILRFKNIQFNQDSVTEDMFTVRRLKKGL